MKRINKITFDRFFTFHASSLDFKETEDFWTLKVQLLFNFGKIDSCLDLETGLISQNQAAVGKQISLLNSLAILLWVYYAFLP